MSQIFKRGTIFGCALALVMCAAASFATAAFASDSIYWSSYTNAGAIELGNLDGSGGRPLVTGESSPEGVAIDSASGEDLLGRHDDGRDPRRQPGWHGRAGPVHGGEPSVRRRDRPGCRVDLLG